MRARIAAFLFAVTVLQWLVGSVVWPAWWAPDLIMAALVWLAAARPGWSAFMPMLLLAVAAAIGIGQAAWLLGGLYLMLGLLMSHLATRLDLTAQPIQVAVVLIAESVFLFMCVLIDLSDVSQLPGGFSGSWRLAPWIVTKLCSTLVGLQCIGWLWARCRVSIRSFDSA